MGAAHPVDTAEIERAVRVLERGGLVAFPTETVYGLGADASNEQAVRRVFAVKGRPADHPLIVHIAAAEQLIDWAREIPSAAAILAKQFWPGPLTLILKRSRQVLDVVTGAQSTVGLRIPSHPVALSLLRACGRGIAAPSANRFGNVSPTTALHVRTDLGDDVDLILDGGATDVGIESTIIDLSRGRPVLLRPGRITREQLSDALGEPIAARDAAAPRASGMLDSHYAPATPARLVNVERLVDDALSFGRRGAVAVIARTVFRPKHFAPFELHWCNLPQLPEGYARLLYATMRDVDALRANVILIESVPETPEWAGVRDRLVRATQH
jgi:L-threonylcarbamoyladenylate synthase